MGNGMMNNEIKEIKVCEVCGNKNLLSVLNLGNHPMCDDLIPIGDARICLEYPIEIMFCETCFTAHQRFQVPKHDLFPSSYHYRSRFTADVLNGMESLVASCEERKGCLKGNKILDIGCNDGSLLDFFKLKGAITLGVEPTNACHDAKKGGHIVYNDFISESLATTILDKYGAPDFIIFTNVFAHIESLQEVINSLKILKAPHTIIVIENHYLGSILEHSQFDTFYHEHPRTYSYTSFDYIARTLGLSLLDVEFPRRYGGNIRVFLGESAGQSMHSLNLKELRGKESHFIKMFSTLQNKIAHWQKTKRNFLEDYVHKNGKIRAKAFPGRAAILIKLLGLDEEIIVAAYEKPGSLKIGHYIPGTKIPIRSDEELFLLNDKAESILNFAWHIPQEIRMYMENNGHNGIILDVLGSEDFLFENETVS